ncbi:MAG: sugar nucleotide-binding protein [Candidatus Aenigmarchaeota archaeon]|nr:sugar nucleotide-binding protein [Candidatus Aenigmarchaeota archaeon]MDW8149087.1 sugar nucleotide-binding protein [Candidatus Aenigmarchaeota archaeon]
MKKILITGSSGRLGKELIKFFPNSLHPSRSEMDITNKDQVYQFIEKNKPEIIIHLAALTDVRECENKKDLAWKTNVDGTYYLVSASLKFVPEVYFVYMSTPCVFSGEEGNYNEDSIPYPKNFYALTKLLGEVIVRYSELKKWLIIRGNFVTRDRWPYPKAFVDRYGTYLFSDQMAKAIKEVLDNKMTGIVHIVGDKKLSMYEVAKITTPDVLPLTLKEYNGPPLTKDMSLETKRWKKYSILS